MIANLIGENVVVDLRNGFLCLGRLVESNAVYLALADADFHDLNDTKTSRENYVVDSKRTGIKANRKRVLIMVAEVVAITRFDDVIDE
jgi:hypothetical protein